VVRVEFTRIVRSRESVKAQGLRESSILLLNFLPFELFPIELSVERQRLI